MRGFMDERGWENIFGMEISWSLAPSVQTNPDGCNIVDPAPHATVSCISQIFGYEVKCKVKETPHRSPKENCECLLGESPLRDYEDCIKIELNVKFACDFKSVKVGADDFTGNRGLPRNKRL